MSGDRPGLVVLGAGGHARACLDVLLGDARFEVLGAVAPRGGGSLQVGLLGDEEDLDALRRRGASAAFVAIGDNAVRDATIRRLREDGWALPSFVAPSAVLSPVAALGEGVLLMPGAVVNAYARLGDGAVVNTAASVDHDCVLGDAVHVAPGARLAGTVTVGAGSLVGVGAAVVPSVRIGSWSVVGAGAVVVQDVPDRTTVIGVPARAMQEGTRT